MDELDELSERIWAWRAVTQPRTRDDIPRVVRPPQWRPVLGAAAAEQQRVQQAAFAAELSRIQPESVPDLVDHRLLRSALARVTWELDIARFWHQPRFYTDQALGPVFDTLLPREVDAARVREVVRLLANVPAVLDVGREVLPARAAREFTRVAVSELENIDERVRSTAAALGRIPGVDVAQLTTVTDQAAQALVGYRDWLRSIVSDLPPAEPIGPANFEWFLSEVACNPLSAQEIRTNGRRESERAVVLELLTRQRFRAVPPPPLPISAEDQSDEEKRQQRRVRDFYEQECLLSQPASLADYTNAPMPDYLEPLRFLGVTDDLTSADRLHQDGVSYVPAPTEALPYFYAANAADTRAGIVHEGAHYQQLALAWRDARPVRRHFYDSGANEGIAFYNEELMLAAGLFEDAPNTQITMYNFMRLRALRAEIDVGLATGEITIDRAAELLRTQVPMDAATAAEEAAFFAETPGQALAYQTGKTQLLGLIADARILRFDS